jgi:hypothetical protein
VGTDEQEPPFQGELTIIWKEEKQDLHDRLNGLDWRIQALEHRIKTLEAWALQVRPNR